MNKSQQTINLRTNLIALFLIFAGIIFVVRLGYLQLVRHGHYTKLAEAEQRKSYDIPAERGLIYLKDGNSNVAVVMNGVSYTLYADQTLIKNVPESAKLLAEALEGKIKQSEIESKLRVVDNKPNQYVVLADNLSQDTADKILKEEISGVNVTKIAQRSYPEGKLGAQLLGFVNASGKGQYGVEGAMNKQLAGTPGKLKAVTDVDGVPLLANPDNVALEPVNGKNVALTIDRNIQSSAEQTLLDGLKNARATEGSMIVVDPNTGAIKAMANYPTYNPAKYYNYKDSLVFQNRTVSAPYEVGSVMKIMTMGASLDAGVITPGSTFYNAGEVTVNDFTIKNAPGDEPFVGTRDMTEVLQYSLNTGTVWMLQQMGGGSINLKAKNTLYNYFTDRYGFGRLTGIEEADEQPGYVADPRKSSEVRYANMSFGQGLTTSMLQYVAAYSSVINGGKYYKPYLVDGLVDSDGKQESVTKPEVLRRSINPTAAKQTTDMMVTARSKVPSLHASDPAGFVVGGKSGTSQKVDAKTGKYSDTDYVSSYVGFTGNPKPKYVIMVRVDNSQMHGATGATAANPIFASMNKWMINYYRMAPQ